LASSLSGAERAIAVARTARAPIGELDVLCRRLRQSALDVDRSLRIAQHASIPVTDAEMTLLQARDLVASASDIQRAAFVAVTGIARPSTAELVRDVQLEVDAVTAGVVHAAEQVPVRSSPAVARP
jgi:hypothetical protein